MPRLPEGLILLAGGKSERAGEPKGLRSFQGRSWLEEQLERFKAAGGSRAVLILGQSPESYAVALEGARDIGLELEVVVNPQPERGPFSSIQCGLQVLSEGQAAFVQPIDVPCPEPGVWRSLRDAAGRSRPGALAALPSVGGKGGHPVWISSPLSVEFLSRPATSRLDEALRALPPSAVVRVETGDPSVGMNLNTPADWSRYRSRSSAALEVELGTDAGILSIAEVGLGSLIHAFHVPAGGQLLSLNQAFLLSRSTLRTRDRGAPLRVSVVAALLKSLSPAGKKLTPMLAISMQGSLFAAGTGLLGANVAGVALGAALLSVWALAQPLLISYMIFGKSFFQVAQLLFEKASELVLFPRTDLWRFVLLLVCAKAVVAALVALAAAFLPETLVSRYVARLRAIALRPVLRGEGQSRNAFSGALTDLSRPLFLLPLGLSLAFLLFSESAHASLVWALLRPLAIGYALFLAVRLISFERLIGWLERRGYASTSRRLRVALAELLPGLD